MMIPYIYSGFLSYDLNPKIKTDNGEIINGTIGSTSYNAWIFRIQNIKLGGSYEHFHRRKLPAILHVGN